MYRRKKMKKSELEKEEKAKAALMLKNVGAELRSEFQIQ